MEMSPRSTCHQAWEPLVREHDPEVLSPSIDNSACKCPMEGYCVATLFDARLSVDNRLKKIPY